MLSIALINPALVKFLPAARSACTVNIAEFIPCSTTLSNVTPGLYLALIAVNCATYSSVVSLASGKNDAATNPSIVVGLTPRASNVFASPPTEPAMKVNLPTRFKSSAAFKTVAVTSVVPNKITNLIGVAEIAVKYVFATSAVTEEVGYKVVFAGGVLAAVKPAIPSLPNSSACANNANGWPDKLSLMYFAIIFASIA